MRKRLVVLGTTLAIVGLFATVGLASESREAITPGHPRLSVDTHRTVQPGTSASAVPRAKKGFKKVVYAESDLFALPPQGAFIPGECPKKFTAVSGYFGSAGGVVTDFSAIGPESTREWDFGLLNLTPGDVQTFIGIVCLK